MMDPTRSNPAKLGPGIKVFNGKLQSDIDSASIIFDASNRVALGTIPIASYAATERPVVLFVSNPALPDSRYPAGSYGKNTSAQTLLQVSPGGNAWISGVNSQDLAANSVVAGKIAAGTVTTTELATTEIRVGAGGGKPGMFGVYDGSNTQVGFVGSSGAVSGAWFKTLGIGGTAYSNSPIYADASGNVTINGPVFTLTANGVTTKINNATGSSGSSGLTVTDTSTGTHTEISQSTFRVINSGGVNLVALDGVSSNSRLSLSSATTGYSMNLDISSGLRIFGATTTQYGPSGILIGGVAGISGSFNYAKPGGATGVITIVGGVVTSIT